jgi:hypothetical protein
MHHYNFHTSVSLNTYKIVNEEDIKQAVAEIETLERLNYYTIIKKYHLTYITLIRHA